MQNNQNTNSLFIHQRTNQHLYAITLSYLLSFSAFLNCINALLNFIGFRTSLDTVVIYGMLWLLIFVSLLKIAFDEKMKVDTFAVLLLFVMTYMGTIILFPENVRYMFTSLLDYSGNPIYIVFIYSFSGFFIVRYLYDFDIFKTTLRSFSYIVVVISSLVYFLARDSFAGQYMTLSYNMLLQCLVLLYSKPKKFLWLHYIILATGIFVLVFGGARGALLGFLTGLILPGIFNTSLNAKGIIKVIVFILSVSLVIGFYNEILSFTYDTLSSVGIESRTLNMIINPIDDFSSGRFNIIRALMSGTNFIGHGLFGDRVLLGGGFAHNLFVEWIIDFGLIFGVILIILMIWLLFRGMSSKNTSVKQLIMLLVPNGFVALMISSSYLRHTPHFYVLLGLCISDVTSITKKHIDSK